MREARGMEDKMEILENIETNETNEIEMQRKNPYKTKLKKSSKFSTKYLIK